MGSHARSPPVIVVLAEVGGSRLTNLGASTRQERRTIEAAKRELDRAGIIDKPTGRDDGQCLAANGQF